MALPSCYFIRVQVFSGTLQGEEDLVTHRVKLVIWHSSVIFEAIIQSTNQLSKAIPRPLRSTHDLRLLSRYRLETSISFDSFLVRFALSNPIRSI